MKVQMSSGGHGLPALLPLGVGAARSGLDQLLHRDRVAPRALHADHVLELRHPVANLVDLGELLVVLDDDRLGVGVLEDVLALVGRVRLVDRNHRRADAERREVEVGPLRAGVGEDRDLVALLDPELDQAERELADDLADLGVGLGDPLSRLVLVGDGLEVAVSLRGERCKIRDRLALRAGLRGAAAGRDRCALHGTESIRRLAEQPAREPPRRSPGSSGSGTPAERIRRGSCRCGP